MYIALIVKSKGKFRKSKSSNYIGTKYDTIRSYLISIVYDRIRYQINLNNWKRTVDFNIINNICNIHIYEDNLRFCKNLFHMVSPAFTIILSNFPMRHVMISPLSHGSWSLSEGFCNTVTFINIR